MKYFTSSMKRFVSYCSVFGAIFPVIIYATSFVPAISDIWWWHEMIIYIWPTSIFMMGFSGPVDIGTWVALGLSALLNAVIYAVCASGIYTFFFLIRDARSK